MYCIIIKITLYREKLLIKDLDTIEKRTSLEIFLPHELHLASPFFRGSILKLRVPWLCAGQYYLPDLSINFLFLCSIRFENFSSEFPTHNLLLSSNFRTSTTSLGLVRRHGALCNWPMLTLHVKSQDMFTVYATPHWWKLRQKAGTRCERKSPSHRPASWLQHLLAQHMNIESAHKLTS